MSISVLVNLSQSQNPRITMLFTKEEVDHARFSIEFLYDLFGKDMKQETFGKKRKEIRTSPCHTKQEDKDVVRPPAVPVPPSKPQTQGEKEEVQEVWGGTTKIWEKCRTCLQIFMEGIAL